MTLVTSDIDKNTSKVSSLDHIFLDHQAIPEEVLSQAQSWPKLELMTYTASYGELIYQDNQYTGVLYIDHDQRLLSEQLYNDDLIKEHKSITKKLGIHQARRFNTIETVEEKLRKILEKDFKYHTVKTAVVEKETPQHHYKVPKKTGPQSKYYSFTYQIIEVPTPLFESYQLLLIKGWGKEIDQALNTYYFLNKEDPLEEYIQESLAFSNRDQQKLISKH